MLVDTYNYETLECKARDYKVNQTDAAGLYDIKWSKTGNTFNAGGSSMSGTLKALFDIRDGNNGENFSGLAKVLNSTEVQITNPSITSIVGVSMPEEGILTINGREYAYEGFTFEQDADGNITSYTFNMKRALTAEEQARVDGRTASVGTSIDAMGIPYYMSQMNQFLRSFATEFNNILKKVSIWTAIPPADMHFSPVQTP